MEAEKSHDLLSASWRSRKAGGVHPSPSQRPEKSECQRCKSREDQRPMSRLKQMGRDTHWRPLPLTGNWTFWTWDWLGPPYIISWPLWNWWGVRGRNSNNFGHFTRRVDWLEKTLMLGGIGGRRRRGRQRMRWWTPGVGDGQGGLACCNSCGCKESDTTDWLN